MKRVLIIITLLFMLIIMPNVQAYDDSLKVIVIVPNDDYDVDDEGFILDSRGSRIPSAEIPSTFLKVDTAFLAPGSLDIYDGSPTSISKFIRERVESTEPSSR